MSNRKLIADEYRDSDGYWIELKPGYRMPGDAHGIHEDTRRKARGRLREVVPCTCAECKALAKAEAK